MKTESFGDLTAPHLLRNPVWVVLSHAGWPRVVRDRVTARAALVSEWQADADAVMHETLDCLKVFVGGEPAAFAYLVDSEVAA